MEEFNLDALTESLSASVSGINVVPRAKVEVYDERNSNTKARPRLDITALRCRTHEISQSSWRPKCYPSTKLILLYVSLLYPLQAVSQPGYTLTRAAEGHETNPGADTYIAESLGQTPVPVVVVIQKDSDL